MTASPLVTPVTLLLGVASARAGYGDYRAAMILSPGPGLILTSSTSTLRLPTPHLYDIRG